MSASRLSISLLCGASLFAIACSKGGGAAKEDLALVPQETELVVGVNIARMRGTAMWKKLMDLSASNADKKKDIDEFGKNCVDATSADGPESIFVALPQIGKGAAPKDGAVVIRLKSALDDAKIGKCMEYLASKNGEKTTTADYNGKKIYTSGNAADADKGGVVLLDGKTIVLGSGAWVKKAIDLSAGKDQNSAKKNEALGALVKRAKTGDAIWAAGTVPQSVRDSFQGNPMLGPMTSLKAAFGSADFASGLSLDVNLDSGSDADAKAINDQVTTSLTEAKKSPQVMMLGVASMLEPIKTEAKGPSFHLSVSYNQQQVDEMVGRVQGLMKGFGGAIGAK
jgi:hypothetical protein